MSSSLLSTYVQIPPARQRVVPRPCLVAALKRAVPGYPLTLVSAPAGYGKTMLLAQWAHVSQLPGYRLAQRIATSGVSAATCWRHGGNRSTSAGNGLAKGRSFMVVRPNKMRWP